MAISFPPNVGEVLICDFSTGFRKPEMVKRRPALVVSPRLRHRDGLCTVVPLSTTPPQRVVPHQCLIRLPYAPPEPFSAVDCWAKADMLATVSYSRLNLFRDQRGPGGKRKYHRLKLDPVELEKVRTCIRVALGLT